MGRDPWYAKACGYRRDPKVVELGIAHGPGGPYAIDCLLAAAKEQNTDGTVRSGYASLAREAFLDGADAARAVIADAARVRLITLEHEDDVEFTVSFPRWSKHQFRADAARRKQDQRHRENVTPERDIGVTDRDTSVTERDPYINKDIATQCPEIATQSPTSSTIENARERGRDAEIRELFEDWRGKLGNARHRLTQDRSKAIRARLHEGYEPDDIRAAFEGARKFPYVADVDGKVQRARTGKPHEKHVDIELICRNRKKLESFMALAERPERSVDEMFTAR